MRYLFVTISLSVMLFTASVSCSPAGRSFGEPPAEHPDQTEDPSEGGNTGDNDNQDMNIKISIKLGSSSFTATLQESDAAKAFLSLLPFEAEMNDHAGNEKYYNLPASLPVDSFRPGTIRSGDLMLWGEDCIVLFYRTFSSPYSYTRIGAIDDPSHLAEAVGDGRIRVTFDHQ